MKRAITAPWQASELSWDGCLLVNSPLGGNFLPSPRRSQDPENWGQAPPISGSQSVSLLHGTPRRGPLCTVERSRDFTDAPTGQRHSLRAETRGLGGDAWRAVPWPESGGRARARRACGRAAAGGGAGCGPPGLFNSKGERAPSLGGSRSGRGARSRRGRAAHEGGSRRRPRRGESADGPGGPRGPLGGQREPEGDPKEQGGAFGGAPKPLLRRERPSPSRADPQAAGRGGSRRRPPGAGARPRRDRRGVPEGGRPGRG